MFYSERVVIWFLSWIFAKFLYLLTFISYSPSRSLSSFSHWSYSIKLSFIFLFSDITFRLNDFCYLIILLLKFDSSSLFLFEISAFLERTFLPRFSVMKIIFPSFYFFIIAIASSNFFYILLFLWFKISTSSSFSCLWSFFNKCGCGVIWN